MAENRSFDPTTPQANRAAEQGLGVGRREMDGQRDPGRDQHATDPGRTEPFPKDNAASQAGGGGDRGAADADGGEPQGATLGEGAPAGLDIHDAGQGDNPQEDWGDPAGEGAAYSANHTRRPVKTEADRGQGKKTRAAQKDQISRRM